MNSLDVQNLFFFVQIKAPCKDKKNILRKIEQMNKYIDELGVCVLCYSIIHMTIDEEIYSLKGETRSER